MLGLGRLSRLGVGLPAGSGTPEPRANGPGIVGVQALQLPFRMSFRRRTRRIAEQVGNRPRVPPRRSRRRSPGRRGRPVSPGERPLEVLGLRLPTRGGREAATKPVRSAEASRGRALDDGQHSASVGDADHGPLPRASFDASFAEAGQMPRPSTFAPGSSVLANRRRCAGRSRTGRARDCPSPLLARGRRRFGAPAGPCPISALAILRHLQDDPRSFGSRSRKAGRSAASASAGRSPRAGWRPLPCCGRFRRGVGRRDFVPPRRFEDARCGREVDDGQTSAKASTVVKTTGSSQGGLFSWPSAGSAAPRSSRARASGRDLAEEPELRFGIQTGPPPTAAAKATIEEVLPAGTMRPGRGGVVCRASSMRASRRPSRLVEVVPDCVRLPRRVVLELLRARPGINMKVLRQRFVLDHLEAPCGVDLPWSLTPNRPACHDVAEIARPGPAGSNGSSMWPAPGTLLDPREGGRERLNTAKGGPRIGPCVSRAVRPRPG